MPFLFLNAYFHLVRFEFYLARGNFAKLHRTIREQPLGLRSRDPNAIEGVCYAVDIACLWYWKEVFCLQRSAVTTFLLKKHGIAAQLVLGAQQLPFKAHAWVEVSGRVVNDKPYMRDIYAVLDRC